MLSRVSWRSGMARMGDSLPDASLQELRVYSNAPQHRPPAPRPLVDFAHARRQMALATHFPTAEGAGVDTSGRGLVLLHAPRVHSYADGGRPSRPGGQPAGHVLAQLLQSFYRQNFAPTRPWLTQLLPHCDGIPNGFPDGDEVQVRAMGDGSGPDITFP